MNIPAKQKVEEFFKSYPVRSRAKNQIIIYPNEEPEGIFYISSGKIKQYDISQQGNEVMLNIFKPGSYIPMHWAVNKTAIKYYFEVMEDCQLYLAPASEVLDFLMSNRDVMLDLLSRLYSGSLAQQRRMAHMMAGNAQTRVLFELITEAKRFGTTKMGQTSLKLTETDLARLAGLSRETTSKEINKLKRKGLIKINNQEFTFKLENLETLLDDRL